MAIINIFIGVAVSFMFVIVILTHWATQKEDERFYKYGTVAGLFAAAASLYGIILKFTEQPGLDIVSVMPMVAEALTIWVITSVYFGFHTCMGLYYATRLGLPSLPILLRIWKPSTATRAAAEATAATAEAGPPAPPLSPPAPLPAPVTSLDWKKWPVVLLLTTLVGIAVSFVAQNLIEKIRIVEAAFPPWWQIILALIILATGQEVVFRLSIQNFIACRLRLSGRKYWIAILLATLVWVFSTNGVGNWGNWLGLVPLGILLGWLCKRFGVGSTILVRTLIGLGTILVTQHAANPFKAVPVIVHITKTWQTAPWTIEPRTNTLWVGKSDKEYDPGGIYLIQYSLSPAMEILGSERIDPPNDQGIGSLCASNGILYGVIGNGLTGIGIFAYEISNEQWTYIPGAITPPGNCLALANGQAAFYNRYNQNCVQVLHQGDWTYDCLGDEAIADMAQDEQGRLWLLTDAGDLLVANLPALDWKRIPWPEKAVGRPDMVYSLSYIAPGAFWIGSSNGTYRWVAEDGQQYPVLMSSVNQHRTVVILDRRGRTWIIGDDRITRSGSDGFQIIPFPYEIWPFAFTEAEIAQADPEDDWIYIATHDGIYATRLSDWP